jgi:hypothetical protein
LAKFSKKITASIVSVHTGDNEDMSKESTGSVRAELDGFVGDKHRSYSRVAYEGESVPVGTTCRNSRQWSGVAVEELAKIQQAMELETSLTAETLGANLCFEALADFSRLPKGTELWFPSGAILVVENYNPPCQDMSEKIARIYTTISGESPRRFAFAMAAKRLRGLVGVVKVAGEINAGDEVIIKVYDPKQ